MRASECEADPRRILHPSRGSANVVAAARRDKSTSMNPSFGHWTKQLGYSDPKRAAHQASARVWPGASSK